VVLADDHVNRSGATITSGVREIGARLNNDAASFDRTADNLWRASQAKGLPIDTLLDRTLGCDEAFKEFKAIVFYDERGEHWHETLRFCRRSETGDVIRHEAARLKFDDADKRISNVDGASWIREQLEDLHPNRLELDGLGPDFYHLAENVHKCRRIVFGSDSEDGQQWASDLLHVLKHDGYQPTWDTLVEWRAT